LKTDPRDRNNYPTDDDRGYKPLDDEKLAPWMTRSTQKIRNTLVRFHNEIIDFVSYVMPSKDDHNLREQSLAK